MAKQRREENEQLCWKCKKACGGCSWSDNLTPVDGWDATPTIVKDSMGDFESFKIKKCPEFIEEWGVDNIDIVRRKDVGTVGEQLERYTKESHSSFME